MKTAKKVRLDQFLLDQGLAPTRTKAQALILAGRVQVDGKIVIKAGQLINPATTVELLQPDRYVSRGGEKLAGALEDFSLSPRGCLCLDVGASTGGFTDCLLQHGATQVYAVDVGTHQLADSLRKDSRVQSFEQTHILDFKITPPLPPPLAGRGNVFKGNSSPREGGGQVGGFDFVVIDVSFISLKKVLPKIKELGGNGAKIVALIKPQFEVGAKFLKKGIVRDPEVQKRAVDDIIGFAQELDFEYVAQTPSRLKGPKGNQEYFVYLRL